MEYDIVLLRLLHVVAGTYWVGVGLFTVIFLTPVIRAVGPEGQVVMRRLVGQTRFPLSMSLAAMMTVVAGAILFWRVSGHLDLRWIQSLPGVLLSLGALTGIGGFLVSALVQSRAAARLQQIGRGIEAGDYPPIPEQIAMMKQHEKRLFLGARVTGVLILISLVTMASWRYIS